MRRLVTARLYRAAGRGVKVKAMYPAVITFSEVSALAVFSASAYSIALCGWSIRSAHVLKRSGRRLNVAYLNRVFSVAVVGSLAAFLGAGCGSSSSKPNTDAGADGDAQKGDTGSDTSTDTSTDVSTDTTGDTGGGGQDALPDAGITPVKLIVSKTTLALIEGSSTSGMDTFTVKLDMPWSTPITVTLISGNNNVAIAAPETLEFPANDTGEQMVTVRAIEDDDIVDNSTTLSLSSIETGTVTVKVDVKDSDVQALLATPTSVSINEAGRTETVSVRLAKKPASAVVVTAASNDTARLTLAPTTMTFNAGNYSIPQQITLTAPADADAANDRVTLTLTPTGTIPALPIP
ncbi:MAG: hypothetical protein ABUS79_20945, partial [Pseudomonadota bacterium]